MEKKETGIDILDTRLDGGLPEGSVVSLVASPMSMGELFLYQLVSTGPAHYFTTTRSVENVENGFESFGVQVDTSNLEIVDAHSSYGDVCDFTLEKLRDVGEGENIIFDTFSHYINNHQDRCSDLLNEIKMTSREKNSLSYLYMLKEEDEAYNSYERNVLHTSDIIFRLILNIEGEQIENRLAIPKFRGGEPFDKTIKLKIGKKITIDTSRDIA